ncbi:MAG: diguanylate cyclase [Armatimonadota bacterium]
MKRYIAKSTDDIVLDDLTELVSETTLQQVQDTFSEALGIPILFVSSNGRLVTMSEKLETFCWQFTKQGKAKKPCKNCGRHEAEGSAHAEFTCSMDLTDIALPIKAGDETVGYVVTSLVTTEPGAPTALAVALDSGLPAPKAVKYASNIPVAAPDWKTKVWPGLNALQSMVSELATASRGNMLHTIVDPLTGLANRAYFWECLSRELETAKTHDYPISLLLVDLDGFKEINSVHGHVTGDRVLQSVGKIILKEIRSSDLVARYAGDSFLVMLRCADQAGAEIVAWRLDKRIAACDIVSRGRKIPVSAHTGLATYPACAADDPDTLFKAAFANLCRSRESTQAIDQPKAA